MAASPRIKLPPDWPGNEAVLSALTMLRMAGHWSPWLTDYVKSPEHTQHRLYWLLRMRFYQNIHGLNADYANKQGL